MRAFWLVSVVTLVIDQLSKAGVRSWLAPGDSVALLPGVFYLDHVRNEGAAFGMLPGRQPVFIAISMVVLLVVALYWRRSRPTAWPIVIAVSLVTSGALGNLIDRVWLGRVTDFFYFAPIDFPVFNVADSAIFVGVGMLIVWLLVVPEETHAHPEETQQEGGA